jgi:hypothetical protein
MTRALIACEFSGAVRRALAARGHDVLSCDILPAEDGATLDDGPHGSHYTGDVRDVLANPEVFGKFDLMVAHPPCTHLANSGARWCTDHWVKKKSLPEGRYWHDGSEKRALRDDALAFVSLLMDAAIERIAIENPISALSTLIRKPDQIIQPWQFGHGETKATCLWLKNLPKLKPTAIVAGREQRIWRMGKRKGIDRGKERSRTYAGIAEAIAEQWGSLPATVH